MQNKKRILLIGELYKPLISWFLYDEAPKGVPGVYNLYKFLSQSENYCFHGILYNKELNIIKEYPNGSVLEIRKLSFPTYYLWKLLAMINLVSWGNQVIKKKKIDLVYGLSTFALVARIIGKKNHIPSVGRIYGTILTKPLKEKRYLRLYTRFFFDILSIKYPCDHVVATYDGTAYDQVFHHWNKKKKVKLLFNGMEKTMRERLLKTNPVRFMPNQETINLCYIARLEYYKQQELAIEMMRELVHNWDKKNFKLNIIGSGSKDKVLQQMVNDYDLSQNVHFIKEVEHEKIPELLEDHHLALFFYEGGSLGNTLWECGMAGKLLVLLDNGSTGEVFTDGVNCIMEKEGKDFPQRMAKRMATLDHREMNAITSRSRKLIQEKITLWNNRFQEEFIMIFEQEENK